MSENIPTSNSEIKHEVASEPLDFLNLEDFRWGDDGDFQILLNSINFRPTLKFLSVARADTQCIEDIGWLLSKLKQQVKEIHMLDVCYAGKFFLDDVIQFCSTSIQTLAISVNPFSWSSMKLPQFPNLTSLVILLNEYNLHHLGVLLKFFLVLAPKLKEVFVEISTFSNSLSKKLKENVRSVVKEFSELREERKELSYYFVMGRHGEQVWDNAYTSGKCYRVIKSFESVISEFRIPFIRYSSFLWSHHFRKFFSSIPIPTEFTFASNLQILAPVESLIFSCRFGASNFRYLQEKETPIFYPFDRWQLGIMHQRLDLQYGRKVRIAVLDTGYDSTHISKDGSHTFSRVVKLHHSFVPYENSFLDMNGHGTHTAGTILKIAPEADLLICKVLNNDGHGNSKWIADGIQWAVDNDADILSISFGSDRDSQDVFQKIQYAISLGKIIVCAASNETSKCGYAIQYPARYGSVLCVGSHDFLGRRSQFCPSGREMDFLAPGEDIIAPAPRCFTNIQKAPFKMRYPEAYLSGTSMATSFVTGLLACLLSFDRHDLSRRKLINVQAVRVFLREMCTSPGEHSSSAGHGVLNPYRSFRLPTGLQYLYEQLEAETSSVPSTVIATALRPIIMPSAALLPTVMPSTALHPTVMPSTALRPIALRPTTSPTPTPVITTAPSPFALRPTTSSIPTLSPIALPRSSLLPITTASPSESFESSQRNPKKQKLPDGKSE